jgi:hypothetical protein
MSDDNLTVTISQTDLDILVASGKVIVSNGTLHNDFAGKQGGDALLGQFYHLAESFYNKIINGDYLERADGTLAGNLNIDGFSLNNVYEYTFKLTGEHTRATGKTYWNESTQTTATDLLGDEVTLDNGQELHLYARNAIGAEMPNGKVVSITGATGNRVDMEYATTTPQATSGAIGMSTENIPKNQDGYYTTFGYLRGLNTSAFPTGSRLFLSDTPGELSVSLPPIANRKVFMGICILQHPTDGEIWISPINIFYLDELSGVDTTGRNDGDVVYWDAATGTHKYKAP